MKRVSGFFSPRHAARATKKRKTALKREIMASLRGDVQAPVRAGDGIGRREGLAARGLVVAHREDTGARLRIEDEDRLLRREREAPGPAAIGVRARLDRI